MRIPSAVKAFSRILFDSGHEAYLVGGTVRDRLLKRTSGDTDFDIAVSAAPREVMKLYRRVIPTGIDHGTVTVLYRNWTFEVTTFRSDGTYSDARHPDEVTYSDSIHEDLKRRDFTVNALAVHCRTGELIDDHGGLDDLAGRTIRSVGDPRERFSEDALRMLRACRFACQLGFTIEEKTFQAVQDAAEQITKVSAERIRDELNGIMSSEAPSIGLEYLRTAALMEHIMPELLEGYGVAQKGNHIHDVYRHSIYSCDGAPPDILLRWAALLHDIGKPSSLDEDELGIPTFHRHEQISAEKAEKILRRLRFSNSDTAYILHLIRQHMFSYTPQWSDAAVRRFLSQAGYEVLDDLFALRRADQYGTFGRYLKKDGTDELRNRIERIRLDQDALGLKDLAVNGADVMKELSLPPGKEIGTILNALLEAVLDDPSLNTRDTLLSIARNYYRTYLADR